MKLKLAFIGGLILCSAPVQSRDAPPLRNPALLNIGFVCRWQAKCMKVQERAMKRSLKFVRKKRPPTWKIELCNRNASRGGTRVDWVGYHNCIRNPKLTPPPPRPARKRRTR
jgi:hypothetical protein